MTIIITILILMVLLSVPYMVGSLAIDKCVMFPIDFEDFVCYWFAGISFIALAWMLIFAAYVITLKLTN